MADKLIVDCTTGEQNIRPLTGEEVAQRDADTVGAQAQAQAEADAAAQEAADVRAWRDAVSKAASIADIKALLLGSNTPVAPVVDRKP